MKMKKFTAPSIAEAMKQIRIELGDDAVIINSKVVISKKFFGLVQKKHFEVLAGIDSIERKPAPTTNFNNTSFSLDQPILKQVDMGLQQQAPQLPEERHQQEQSALSNELKKEIADLKQIMQSMKKQSIQADYPVELTDILSYLKNQELDEELVTQIGDELFALSTKTSYSKEALFLETKRILRAKIEALPLTGLDYNKKYIHVLGPTGVGKTTTIAKMAARSVLEKKKKIGFVTTDTYRIAAIEQLKTYAGLLQAPVEIVYSATDYEEALKRLDYLDIIFVDTAGRNYKEQKYVDDLQKLVKFDEHSESFLVLSMTSKQKDLETIIEQFKAVPVEKFIFTKVDETNSIGTMFNLMIKYNKGLAYYTNGQEVPEDIEQANLDNLLDLFFQGEL
jgi:flagellar biosynthesis protein FlhF